MLSLSHSLAHVVRALTYLEDGDCKMAFVREIAEAANLPPAYLAKLFTRLVEAGLLESKRGWKGGTRLARPAAKISVFEIADAIEPPGWLDGCLLGRESCCCAHPCPTHVFWNEERNRVEHALHTLTLADVIALERKRGPAPPASPGESLNLQPMTHGPDV